MDLMFHLNPLLAILYPGKKKFIYDLNEIGWVDDKLLQTWDTIMCIVNEDKKWHLRGFGLGMVRVEEKKLMTSGIILRWQIHLILLNFMLDDTLSSSFLVPFQPKLN